MGVEGLTEEARPDLAQLQKDAAAREEEKIAERNAQREARRVRLGHVEETEEKPKAKSKSKPKAEKESDKESE